MATKADFHNSCFFLSSANFDDWYLTIRDIITEEQRNLKTDGFYF